MRQVGFDRLVVWHPRVVLVLARLVVGWKLFRPSAHTAFPGGSL